METIFDHNITAEEYALIIGSLPKEKYLKLWSNSKDTCNQHICYLLYERKDKRYKQYLEKLPVNMQLDFGIITTHPL